MVAGNEGDVGVCDGVGVAGGGGDGVTVDGGDGVAANVDVGITGRDVGATRCTSPSVTGVAVGTVRVTVGGDGASDAPQPADNKVTVNSVKNRLGTTRRMGFPPEVDCVR